MPNKLVHVAGVLFALAVFPTACGADVATKSATDAVGLDPSHRAYLMRTARRTVRDAVLQREPYDPTYIPSDLASLQREVVVRLRVAGFLIGEASSPKAPIALAVRDASLTATRMWQGHDDAPRDLLGKVLIEIEIVLPAEPIPVEVDWTQPRAVDRFVEPGVHGIELRGPRVHARFCPSELITSTRVLADALRDVAHGTPQGTSDVTQTKLYRFRTDHWIQAQPGKPIVSLHRGLTIVPQSAVSASELDATIERIAEYMIYRQQPSGLFSYQYEPALNRYSDEDNLVRQVGAVAAMATHARYSGRAGSRVAADLGIRYHLQGLTDLPGDGYGSFIATADEKNKLGVTALLALAMSEHPHPQRYSESRNRLINGMLRLQRPSGMFVTAFPPAIEIAAQEYFPGEALLAMAGAYRHRRDARIVDAFDRALEFYRGYFRDQPSPAFVPWQVQAYAGIAKYAKRRDYIDYVFELTDWLADKQLTRSNCEWPELRGGIAAYEPNRVGVSTASYLEGFAEALAIARSVGDSSRANKYERVVRQATRFVMQLQVRRDEAYFVRSPRDAIGGIRSTPTLNLLRIDHCQHALVALIKSRQVLYPDEP